jgi:pimeloyl-ACP methyl ester carboxylesterase
VTIVRGTRDALCPSDWAEHLAAATPWGRLVEIPGAAHMTVQTHPARVAEIIGEVAAAAQVTGRRR